MALIRIVGLGPGDPDLVTLGSLAALRSIGRAVTLLAPPELVLFIESEGVAILRDRIARPALFTRGSRDEIERFVDELDGVDLALGVLGNPLSDFPGSSGARCAASSSPECRARRFRRPSRCRSFRFRPLPNITRGKIWSK